MTPSRGFKASSLEGCFNWAWLWTCYPEYPKPLSKNKAEHLTSGKNQFKCFRETLSPHSHKVSHTNRWPHGWSMSKASPALTTGTGMVSELISWNHGARQATQWAFCHHQVRLLLQEATSLVRSIDWFSFLSYWLAGFISHPSCSSHWLIPELKCLWLVRSEKSPSH